MRWPWSSSSDGGSQDDTARGSKRDRKHIDWADSLNRTDWSQFTEPKVLILSGILTAGTLVLLRTYKIYLRRIPSTEHIKPDQYRKRSIFGTVTSVGDGDNFRLFHTPGGRLAGWGWLPWRRVPSKREDLVSKTISVRIAGVDAPEMAHFGRPAQPYGQEALDFLTPYILHRRVRAYIYRRDQYDRVVATVFVRKWGFRRDVGLQMLNRGLATVYEAKIGSEFGRFEEKYRQAEARAKERKIGIWSKPGIIDTLLGRGKKQSLETPRQFKTRMENLEKQAAKQESPKS